MDRDRELRVVDGWVLSTESVSQYCKCNAINQNACTQDASMGTLLLEEDEKVPALFSVPLALSH